MNNRNLPCRRPWGDWKADAAAGLGSALVSLPVAIGSGLLVTTPLGPEFASLGVQAGLVAAVVGAIVTAIFASSRFSIGGPSAATALLLGSSLGYFVDIAGGADRQTVLTVIAVLALLSGLVLAAMGALRLGSLIKFIPRPVVAGFANGIALLVVYSQIAPAFGLSSGWHLSMATFAAVHWGAVLTAAATVAVCLLAPRWKLPVPPQFIGLAAGVGVHYGARWLFGDAVVGRIIGALPSELPLPHFADDMFRYLQGVSAWGQLLTAAFLLALINAIQTLMTATAVDAAANTRHDANRELIGFGLGNIAVSLFAAAPNSANYGRALTNFRSGARSRWAAIFNGLTMLAMAGLAVSVVAQIPLAALSGLLIHSAIMMVDRWSLDQLRRCRDAGERGEVIENVVVVALMTVGTLWMNPAVAVGAGVLATILLFMRRLSGSVIRRVYTCEARRSLKVRPLEHEQQLASSGQAIHVFELEGPLFFGTADQLRQEVEAFHPDARFVVLDFRRVRDWDATGVQILAQLHRSLATHGTQLLLAHVSGRPDVEAQVRAYGLFKDIPESRSFIDLDRTLEYAEDILLHFDRGTPVDSTLPVAWEATSLVHGMSGDDSARLHGFFETVRVDAGETLFRTGDEGDSLFVLIEGEITLGVDVEGRECPLRLHTLSPGLVFGELALLDAGPRSAHAVADRPSVLKRLDREAYARLSAEAPETFARMLSNLARDTSQRLRMTTRQLTALEA